MMNFDRSVAVVAIVAVAKNRVIGAENGLPWRLSSDLKRFKALTMGKPLIMGRRTYQSLRRSLPGRRLVVVSRDPSFAAPDALIARDPEQALALARDAACKMGASEIMVGGGAKIYEALLGETQRIELTEVMLEPEGDTFLPPLDSSVWREAARETPPRGEKDEADFAFVTLARI